MLSEKSFPLWCRSLGLSEKAKNIIKQIRSCPPNRRVRGGGISVVGFYPSRKMGLTLQFESHKNELATILSLEYDEDVLEFYDQPFPPLRLEYKSKKGRQVTALHTADFFVIYKQSAGWVECKTEQNLKKLVDTQPTRYVHKEDDSWSCPPGEEYTKQFGLSYWVRSSSKNNKTYVRNIEFLEDYLRSESLDIPDNIRKEIIATVKENPGITFERLLQSSTNTTTDHLYGLIAIQAVYVNLELFPLVQQNKIQIYLNKEHFTNNSQQKELILLSELYIGQEAKWNGNRWIIAEIDYEEITFIDEQGSFSKLTATTVAAMLKQGIIKLTRKLASTPLSFEGLRSMAKATPKDLQIANEKHALIKSYLAKEIDIPTNISRTTFYRWLSEYRKAEVLYGNGFLGLINHYYGSGNHKIKVEEKSKALMINFIDDNYETIKQKPMLEVYGALLQECESLNIQAPSYKTFTLEVKRRPRHKQILKRQGSRAAYQAQEFYWDLEYGTPRHGDRPFHVCHIDHTELDVELICSSTGKNLGRPWLTLMTDAFSRRILSIFLTYDPPSYRSCMMSIRECIRKHGRFPQILVVDGGREFDGIYYQTLLARYECTKKTRPEAKPRFGSIVERLFNTTNTQFIYNLMGNTQIMKKVNQVTKSVNPKNHAIWTIGLLYERLCEYVYEVYDTNEHPALGQSPRKAFTDGLIRYGYRKQRQIPYDNEFRILTCPTTIKGMAQVLPGRGVKINNVYYWSSSFRNPEIEKTIVHVRYDPYDIGIAYCYVGKGWVSCISEYYTQFHGHSEKELMLLSVELRKRNQNHSKQLTITAKKLAEFLSTTQADEVLLLQRLKDKETKSILNAIEGEQFKTILTEKNAVDSEEEAIDYSKFVEYEEF